MERLKRVGFPLKASVTRRTFRCGKRNCHCAEGELHEDLVVTRKVNGTTRTVKVRRGREDQAMEWAANWRNLKKVMDELAQAQIDMLATAPGPKSQGRQP